MLHKASQRDKAEMLEEVLALFPYKENNMGNLKSTEDELEPMSQNRCDFYNERFSPKSFKMGSPSPNNQNNCDHQNQAEQRVFPKPFMHSNGCFCRYGTRGELRSAAAITAGPKGHLLSPTPITYSAIFEDR